MKDILKIAVVIVISVVTYNAAAYWAMGAAMNSSAFMLSYGLSGASILAGAVGGAAAGFTAGVSMAAFSGASGSDAFKAGFKGAFAGAVFGGIDGHFGHAWNYSRVAANGVGGGVTAKANGGKFIDGLKTSLATSLLTLANYQMRRAMVRQSELNPDNTGKACGKGFFGDGKCIGGTRRISNKNYPGINENKYLPCDGPAGGCQGSVIPGYGDRASRLGPFEYGPNSPLERLVESFAGPHDWLSDRIGMYNRVTGNAVPRIGFNKFLFDLGSYSLIPMATPFSAAGLIETTGGVRGIFYSSEFQ